MPLPGQVELREDVRIFADLAAGAQVISQNQPYPYQDVRDITELWRWVCHGVLGWKRKGRYSMLRCAPRTSPAHYQDVRDITEPWKRMRCGCVGDE